jgi:hypothetical protein
VAVAAPLTWVLLRPDPGPPAAPLLRHAQPVPEGVELDWTAVSGASGYTVLRDGAPVASAVPGTRFVVRLGADRTDHQYAVISLRGAARSAPSRTLTARALGPWGLGQPLAVIAPSVVPPTPGGRGYAGQTCAAESVPRGDPKVAKINCDYPNGVRVELYRFRDTTTRGLEESEVARQAVVRGEWLRRGVDRPLGAWYGGSSGGAAWRWESFYLNPELALRATWPGHDSGELATWFTTVPL